MFIIYFLKKLFNKFKLNNEMCNQYILHIDFLLKEMDLIFEDKNSFIASDTDKIWYNKNKDLIYNIRIIDLKKLSRTKRFKELIKKQSEFFSKLNVLKNQIILHNNAVAKKRIKSAYDLIGRVENQILDNQQMTCIVKNDYNQLVIAGAGTGKTTTIIGKIKFLLKSKMYNPEDILALSFTNSSANEMKQRIKNETGYNIDAITFHKLGLNIITQVNGKKPKITQINLHKFIKEQLLHNIEVKEYLDMLCDYILYNKVVPKSEFDFKTNEEYAEYLLLNPPTTIDNEVVKSYGEMDIANFLYQNGIEYIYECPYEIDTRTNEYSQYKPDFYLPKHKIYIEYFGIDKEGNVPSYFTGSGEITASQKYQNSMEWKRKLHKKYNTELIECYSFEKYDGVLLDNLKSKLLEKGVDFFPKSSKELWSNIESEPDFNLDGIVELFETVINLMKSNSYSINYVKSLNNNNFNVGWNNVLLNLIKPIYHSYNLYLSQHDEIDFNDMINISKKYIDEKKYINKYKFVIVDEYQDISKARFELLKSMRISNDFKLFCVGDDWQSIYRFAGSDIGFIINFEKYWGPSDISKIETTYRFSDMLISISSNFIMKNPMQIKKIIKGKNRNVSFPLGEINGYNEKYAIHFLTQRLSELPVNSTVFFIGRYSFDIDLLKNNNKFEYNYNNVTGSVDVKFIQRKDLKIQFLTAHKSKGLQADYVFILNNKKSRMGFPSKIQDSPILYLLLDDCDFFPYAEERRLFYVALTRAKKKVFLLTVENKFSIFATELINQYKKEIKREKWECPFCGGRIIKKNGPYGEFYGCSNYRKNGCKYIRKILNE